ncbi:PAS domain S-box protein [Gemmatimonas sp.]|uniref:PAS domain S-box protein n=1 Tax=Gemmatimonas sp. TaxID=1962908 RepID=UPI0037BFED8B
MTSSPFPPAAELLALHDALGDAVVIMDDNGCVTAGNALAAPLLARWQAPTGTALAAAAGVPVAMAAWMRREQQHAAGERFDLADGDGGRVLACALVRLPRGNGWLLRANDITVPARRFAEVDSALQNFRLMTHQMQEMLFLIRVETPGVYVCEAVNPAYLLATGLTEDEVVGHRPEEVLGANEAAYARMRYEQALAAEDPITYREEIALSGGRLVVETRLTVRRDANGQPTHLVGLARNVTDMEQATIALAASEARLRGVLDAGFDAFVVVRAIRGADGRIVEFVIIDVNARACAMVQRTREQIIGGSLLEVFPRSREWGLWEQCCMVVITHQPLETTQFAPNEEEPARWLQRQLVPVDHDAVAISSRDITQRQLERLALESSESRHRLLFESNGAIQLLAEFDTARIVDVNPAAELFYGWPRETMREMFLTDLESIAIDHWRELIAGIATGTGVRLQRDHRIATGELRQVEAFIGVAEATERRLLHIIIQDVTDRVSAERQLRESEARFRAVIAGMREGLVLHDDTGAIRVHNPSAERILGLTGEQLVGLVPVDHDWRALREDGTSWPATDHPAMVALRTGQSQPRQLMGITRGDNEPAWLSVTADPLIRPGEKRPFASVAVFTDVTETRASEERLRQAQKLEAVAQLAGGIGHDYNNLLTVIRGATGFLREGLGPTSPHIEDIAAIERATERAEELTRRLLAVGRRQMLRTEPVELNALLNDQLPIIRDDVPVSVLVRLSLSPLPVTATLDRSRLLDAIRAMVDNARMAMPNGGLLMLGTAEALRQHPHEPAADNRPRYFAMLEVRDTGVGMSDDIRARLFEPFFSTQPFGTSRGMGLASVHGMVHQSRGFIECDSAPGEGTTLRLFFPLTGAPKTPAAGMLAVLPDVRSGSVLLVDDDPMLRELGQRMLDRLAETVHVVGSGAEALSFLASHSAEVSVIITDLTMPEMSGLELIEQLAVRHPAIPVVAVSGFAVNLDARAELDARRIPFVAKPFTLQDLQRALERVRT